MSAGIAEIAFLIGFFNSSSPLTGVRNTLILTKRPMEAKASLPIHLPGNVLSRNASTCRPLWGYVKSSVFGTPVNGLDDLKTRIRNAIPAIPADMLHRTWQEL
jgi:hypothetical protein